MENKRTNPLVLWRVDTHEWAFWPHGRLRLWDCQNNVKSLYRLIYADYGRHAKFKIYRAILDENKKLMDLQYAEDIPASLSNVALMAEQL